MLKCLQNYQIPRKEKAISYDQNAKDKMHHSFQTKDFISFKIF